MVHGPALDLLVQTPDHFSCRQAARVVDRFLDLGQERLHAPRRRLGQDLAAAIAPDVLSQEIEAFLHMRDPGLLVGELEPSFLQEVSHERLDLITKEFLRCAGDQESSGPGEFHPQALSDPDGRLSPHPALMIQSPVESRSARGRTDSDRVAPPDPASGLRWWSDASTVCISAAPI